MESQTNTITSAPMPSPSVSSGQSLPLGENRGALTHVKEFFGGIFGDFYNTFRLTGYLAEAYYSEFQRFFLKKLDLKVEQTPAPTFLKADWKNTPRMLVNTIEAVVFMTTAFFAFHRDRKKLRAQIGEVVGEELGKDPNKLGIGDMIQSQNPIIQTAMNRFKGLYWLRFSQPLTFLWSLKLGVTTTVFQIVAERAAYFEKNGFDRLQRLHGEVGNNQYGSWSRDKVTDQLIDIIQQTRSEHKSPPVALQDIERYLPLLHHLSDELIEKKFNFSDTIRVLGQITKDPNDFTKAEQIFETVHARIEDRHNTTTSALPKPGSRQSVTKDVEKPLSGPIQAVLDRGPQNMQGFAQGVVNNQSVAAQGQSRV